MDAAEHVDKEQNRLSELSTLFAQYGVDPFLESTSLLVVLLNKDGTPDKSLFVEDELHMNAKGYHIWQKIIKPYLLKK